MAWNKFSIRTRKLTSLVSENLKLSLLYETQRVPYVGYTCICTFCLFVSFGTCAIVILSDYAYIGRSCEAYVCCDLTDIITRALCLPYTSQPTWNIRYKGVSGNAKRSFPENCSSCTKVIETLRRTLPKGPAIGMCVLGEEEPSRRSSLVLMVECNKPSSHDRSCFIAHPSFKSKLCRFCARHRTKDIFWRSCFLRSETRVTLEVLLLSSLSQFLCSVWGTSDCKSSP